MAVRKLFGNNILVEKPSLDDIMVYTVKGVKNNA
jgi:hypothetical protein